MPKKLYFETTETTIKNKKGWVEIDTDFTQVYDCFSKISVQLRSISSVKLLFWLLSHECNKGNGTNSGKVVFAKFNKYLVENGSDAISERTFKACFDELSQVKAITRVGRGQYYFNPYLFWRDGKNSRELFIADEVKENKFLSYNPVDLPEQSE